MNEEKWPEDTFGYVDTIPALHAYLGDLLKAYPNLQTCGVFALDSDCLNHKHFLWCDTDGSQVEDLSLATEVTLYTESEPLELINQVRDLRNQLTAALAERDELSQRNRGLENSVALAVTANDSLVADNAKLTKERDATEARVRELEISKDWPRTDAEIDRVLIGHDQLKAMRDHFKKCQLATWADQQKLLKLADNSLLFRSHHQKSAAVCELCLEIYTDIIDRIDALLDPALTPREAADE